MNRGNKKAAGWVYGPKEDSDTKRHPCLVSYGELSDAQKNKYRVVVEVYISMWDL